MRILHFIIITGCISLCACHTQPAPDITKAKEEVAKAEADFEKMAADKGIDEAFFYFAAPDAVIKRGNDSLITGKENIRHYYSAPYFKTASVNWSPDFIDVASNADLAYTFGKYTWQSRDSAGNVSKNTGIFHTVWKKQKEGNWKYVWD